MVRLTLFAGVLACGALLAGCGAAAPDKMDAAAEGSTPAKQASASAGALADSAEGTVVQTDAGPMRVMLVMDSSGSMWGQIAGTSKRDIARAAVREMVSRNPGLDAAGLIAYGHRRTGDCTDIEIVRQPGADVSLPDAVDRLMPVGKTPLTAAVLKAAETMEIETARATVILVTDGIETCDVDPCAAGADLEARGIDFTTHVVGFGLSNLEGRQVACLAEQTGGTYYAAANAGELADALESVAASVETGPPEAATATATVDGPASVEIGAVFEATWTGPGGPRDYVDLVPAGYAKVSGELSYAYAGKPGETVELRAPATPGKFQLRYVWLAPQGRTVIANTPINVVDSPAALSAPGRVGIGQSFDVAWRGPANSGDYIDLVPRGYTKTNGELTYAYTRSGTPVKLKAPGEPGAYEVRYVIDASDGRAILKTLPLDVEAVPVNLAFNPAAPLGGQLAVDWSGPDSEGDYIDVVRRGVTSTNGELSYAYTRVGNPASLRLPGETGAYDVRYVLQAPGGRKILRVTPLELTDITVTLSPTKASGVVGETIAVNWTGPGGASDYIDIVPRGSTSTNGELEYAYVGNGSPVSLMLPSDPGAYDLRYVLQASNGKSVKAVVPISTVAASATLTAPAKLKPGADFNVSWTGPGYRGDYVDLVPAGYSDVSGELDYAYVSQGTSLKLTAPDKAGRYMVRYVLQGANGKRVITSQPISVE